MLRSYCVGFSYYNCGGCVMTKGLMIDGTLWGLGWIFMLIYFIFTKNPFPESKH